MTSNGENIEVFGTKPGLRFSKKENIPAKFFVAVNGAKGQ